MLRAARALHTRSARQYGEYLVLCGQVFMSEKTATAAAERQTNSWCKVEAFPVYAEAQPAMVREACAQVADNRAAEWNAAIAKGLQRLSVNLAYANAAMSEATVIALAIRRGEGANA
ncbi:hypothetical protein [Sphingobium sp. Z007]|nr:hypothetical protein [Sphingobium sp. Z007]